MRAYENLELASPTRQRVLRPTSIQIERELEVLSQLMDNQFRIPILDWRFGFNAWWKPNVRNLDLLRRRATVSAEEAKRGRKSDWLFVGLIVGTIVALLFGSIMLTIFVWWYVATHLQVM